MSADPFQSAALVGQRSRIARAGQDVVACLRLAGARSVALDRLRRARARLNTLAPSERVRLAGVVLLVATITQAVLLRWTPSMVRPAPLGLLRLEIAVVAVLLIVLAKPIARGWAGSRIRRLFSRAGPSLKTSDGDADRA